MQKIINIAELIAEKIKVRYAEITEVTMGSQNMVVDAFYPTYVRESLLMGNRERHLSKKASAISPFIASELGVYQIPFDDLVSMLGYKKKDLKDMLERLKSKNIDLALLGFGGTGINFYHWAEEVCNFTNTVNVFKTISIFDFDNVDLTNLFRFPIIANPDSAYGRTSALPKIHIIGNSTILTKRLMKSQLRITEPNLMDPHTKELRQAYKNTVFYGAPDITTREMMSKFADMKFVSGTHGNDDCQLYVRPVQDSTIQIESYGMINLSVFFINQIKMTIEFLALLASDVDLTQSNLVMEYSFSKEYANNRLKKAGLNRTYKFPINAANFLDQEVGLEAVSDVDTEDTETIQQAQVDDTSDEVVVQEYIPPIATGAQNDTTTTSTLETSTESQSQEEATDRHGSPVATLNQSGVSFHEQAVIPAPPAMTAEQTTVHYQNTTGQPLVMTDSSVQVSVTVDDSVQSFTPISPSEVILPEPQVAARRRTRRTRAQIQADNERAAAEAREAHARLNAVVFGRPEDSTETESPDL